MSERNKFDPLSSSRSRGLVDDTKRGGKVNPAKVSLKRDVSAAGPYLPFFRQRAMEKVKAGKPPLFAGLA